MAAILSQIYFRFLIYDLSQSHLEKQTTICIPNFDQTSQSVAEISLLLVADNKLPPYWNSSPGFDFDLFTVIVIYTNYKIGDDIISIFMVAAIPSKI